MFKFVFILSALLAVGSPSAFAQETVTEAKNNAPDSKHDQAIVVEMASTLSFSDLMKKLANERLVYVGESHTEYGDHLMQLAIIKAFYKDNPKLAIGVEWFQKSYQKVLDNYISGIITEAEMLNKSDYFSRWSFDYRLYRPIIRFAKENGIPLLALNAPAELTDAIKKDGINNLKDDVNSQLPDQIDYSDKSYEKGLRQIYDAHPDKAAEFDRFLAVQLTWDETMAQQAANYLNDNPQHRLIVLAGRGHLSSRSGIPNRVQRRTGLRGTIILVQQQQISDKDAADYILFAKRRALSPAGVMGAMLKTEKSVEIIGFSKESPAEKAGIKKGDIIIRIDGTGIKTFSDLKLAMIDKAPGEKAKIVVRRGKRTKTYNIELADRFNH